VRGTDARSAQIDRPIGVTRTFQVSLYKVEPTEAVFTSNLLTNDAVRLTLRDKVVPVWP